jgi:Holliday junction resolvase-like predicted endonuclease
MRQEGFDFSKLREELSTEAYDGLLAEWGRFRSLLAARGNNALQAGRQWAGMVEAYGSQVMTELLRIVRTPSQWQVRSLLDAWEFFRDQALSENQLAVLDSVVYKKMDRRARHYAFQKVLDGASAEEIDDLVDALFPSRPPGTPEPTVTEADVRASYVAQLRQEGWKVVDNEQPTRDTGAADIVARKDDEILLVECKVILDRASAIEALGQLFVYAHTYQTRLWHIAFWESQDSAAPIMRVCAPDVDFVRVIREREARGA